MTKLLLTAVAISALTSAAFAAPAALTDQQLGSVVAAGSGNGNGNGNGNVGSGNGNGNGNYNWGDQNGNYNGSNNGGFLFGVIPIYS